MRDLSGVPGMKKRFSKADREAWPVGLKGCGPCNRVLALDAFGVDDRGFRGRSQICNECRRAKAKLDYAKRDYRRIILDRVRSRATQRNIPFDLDLEDIIIPDKCPVLGIPLERSSGTLADSSPSVDRIIPALGYTKGNIIIISNRANRIKSDATPQELEMIARFYCGI